MPQLPSQPLIPGKSIPPDYFRRLHDCINYAMQLNGDGKTTQVIGRTVIALPQGNGGSPSNFISVYYNPDTDGAPPAPYFEINVKCFFLYEKKHRETDLFYCDETYKVEVSANAVINLVTIAGLYIDPQTTPFFRITPEDSNSSGKDTATEDVYTYQTAPVPGYESGVGQIARITLNIDGSFSVARQDLSGGTAVKEILTYPVFHAYGYQMFGSLPCYYYESQKYFVVTYFESNPLSIPINSTDVIIYWDNDNLQLTTTQPSNRVAIAEISTNSNGKCKKLIVYKGDGQGTETVNLDDYLFDADLSIDFALSTYNFTKSFRQIVHLGPEYMGTRDKP